MDEKLLDRDDAERQFGESRCIWPRAHLLGRFGCRRLDAGPGLESSQAEALRKMLVAVVGDVRLVVVKLAEQLQRMRTQSRSTRRIGASSRSRPRGLCAARKRLGVWQVKWELEIWLPYLQPAEYRHIAAALKVRRSERERYIQELKELLQRELRAADIEAQIDGRQKHLQHLAQDADERLASIRSWTSRGTRLVSSLADCYAGSAWSIRFGIHSGEFDDYIATPKDNLYRSIHTRCSAGKPAGGDPDPHHDMHAHSERGVAAHWRYKEGGARIRPTNARSTSCARCLRRKSSSAMIFSTHARRAVQDRVYVLSPKGEIVDVPVGGTPLDFAYQVHTDLAIARAVRKSTAHGGPRLSAEKRRDVEIIAAKTAQPSRDWLSPQSGIRQPAQPQQGQGLVRKQDESENKIEGRAMLEREIQRLGVNVPRCPNCCRTQDVECGRSACGDGLGETSAAQVAARFSDCCTPAQRARKRRREFVLRRSASRRPKFRGSATCSRPMHGAADPCRQSDRGVHQVGRA